MFAVYKKLLYYVPKQRPLAYIAIGLTVVSTLLNVGAYYYLYEFLKRLVVDGDMGHAQYNAFLVAGLLIGGSLLYFAAVLLTHMLGFRLETNLRKRGIDGLTNASFRYFDLNSSGKTRKLIDDNAAQTHSIGMYIRQPCQGDRNRDLPLPALYFRSVRYSCWMNLQVDWMAQT